MTNSLPNGLDIPDSIAPVASEKNRKVILEEPAYLEQRRYLCEAGRESLKVFDQAMITLPAGALALTITFMKDIAPHPQSVWLLAQGWFGFALALLSTLASLLTSHASLEKDKRALDDDRERRYAVDYRNWWTAATSTLNWLSIVAFIFGVYRIAGFAALNLPQGAVP